MALPARSILLFLLAAAPLFAQDAPALPDKVAPAPKVQSNGRITGMVLCGDTRKPARGALLVLTILPNADGAQTPEGRHNAMLRVGLDGSYSAEHLAPGEYSVIAMLPGYLTPFDDMVGSQMHDLSPAEQRAMLSRQGTVVVRGSETETLNMTLVRGAAVSGRVLYSDGSPAAQVSIDLEDVKAASKPGSSVEDNMNVGRAMRSMFTQQSISTDDQGHFRVAGLQPGTYRIAALQSLTASDLGGEGGMGMMFGAMIDASALHFFSGDTIHRKAAKTYELRAGDEVTGIDITIPERAFHRLRGQVTGTSGKPANTGELTLTDKTDEAFTYTQRLNTDGVFEFPAVPAGTYTLAVKGAAYSAFTPDNMPRPLPQKVDTQTIQFGAGSQDVIVKDADVVDVAISLPELPPDAKPVVP